MGYITIPESEGSSVEKRLPIRVFPHGVEIDLPNGTTALFDYESWSGGLPSQVIAFCQDYWAKNNTEELPYV